MQVAGIVVSKPELKMSPAKHLYAKVRVKTDSGALVDLYSFGDIAKQLNLLGNLGNYIYTESHVCNKKYVTKKGIARAKVYFMVDYVELIGIPKHAQMATDDSIIEILNEIDPTGYL